MRILVIEDDAKTAESLRVGLIQEGYAVDVALTGEAGEAMAEVIHYDVLILSIILPKKNGLDICQSLRQKDILTPILMLTRMDTREDEIRGLNVGADDYVTKPFHFSTLVARVGALLRRAPNYVKPQLTAGDLVLDTISREVWFEGVQVKVMGKECSILELLMRHANGVVTRRLMEEHAWDYTLDANSNVIDQHIKNLRAKLPSKNNDPLIETVRGVGYRLNVRKCLKDHGLPCISIFLICILSTVNIHMDWFSWVLSADGLM